MHDILRLRQFGLRTLLIGVTVVAAVCGVFAYYGKASVRGTCTYAIARRDVIDSNLRIKWPARGYAVTILGDDELQEVISESTTLFPPKRTEFVMTDSSWKTVDLGMRWRSDTAPEYDLNEEQIDLFIPGMRCWRAGSRIIFQLDGFVAHSSRFNLFDPENSSEFTINNERIVYEGGVPSDHLIFIHPMGDVLCHLIIISFGDTNVTDAETVTVRKNEASGGWKVGPDYSVHK